MNKKYNVAVVGATGLVGRTMIKILEERNFPINNIKLLASKRSVGTKINYLDNEVAVEELNDNSFKNIDIALFSAGNYVSENFAPVAVASNCIVIDNGSFWRLKPDVPLVVPEVNPERIKEHKGIIANPKCSTIQFVIPLYALQKKFGLKRVVASTYQAISGAGQAGLNKFYSEIQDKNTSTFSIFNNIVFHPNADACFTNEEVKMFNETRKILSQQDLKLAITCVRLPIENSHSISANIELSMPASIEEVRNVLKEQSGIVVADDLANGVYPTPQMSNGRDEVFVGRIRQDDSAENGIYLWITADNLRKGAATNAIQIAEKLINKK